MEDVVGTRRWRFNSMACGEFYRSDWNSNLVVGGYMIRLVRWITRKKQPDLFSEFMEGGFVPYNPPIAGLHLGHPIDPPSDIGFHVDNELFHPSNPPLEQLNAQQDVIDTINFMREEFRALGYPIPTLQRGGIMTIEENLERWNHAINIKRKQNLMDRKYPHACFNSNNKENPCKNRIQYQYAFGEACEKYNIWRSVIVQTFSKTTMISAFKEAQKSYAFEKQFRVWWKSPIVQFLCCNCYAKATNSPKRYISNSGWYIMDSEPPEMEANYDMSSPCRFVRDELNNEHYEEP